MHHCFQLLTPGCNNSILGSGNDSQLDAATVHASTASVSVLILSRSLELFASTLKDQLKRTESHSMQRVVESRSSNSCEAFATNSPETSQIIWFALEKGNL